MSTKPLMLEGLEPKSGGDHSEEVRTLRRQVQRLDEELRGVRNDLGQALADKENLERSIRALRNQLSPLHRALRAVFGEIELAVGEEEFRGQGQSSATSAAPANGSDPRWESYKQTFPGVPARIIDALLAHQEMTIVQLSTLVKAAYSTVKDSAAKLVKAGALVRSGKGLRLNR